MDDWKTTIAVDFDLYAKQAGLVATGRREDRWIVSRMP
jgi:hypothetical protein